MVLLRADPAKTRRAFFLGLRLANGRIIPVGAYLFDQERASWRAQLLRRFIAAETAVDTPVKIVDGRESRANDAS